MSGTIAQLFSFSLCERAVDQVDRNGPFAHSRSYPLDVARPNITDGENTRQVRFKHLRNVGRLLPERFSYSIEIATRDDKSFVVQRDATPEPLSSR
jgi:hypothetical protein